MAVDERSGLGAGRDRDNAAAANAAADAAAAALVAAAAATIWPTKVAAAARDMTQFLAATKAAAAIAAALRLVTCQAASYQADRTDSGPGTRFPVASSARGCDSKVSDRPPAGAT